MEEKKPIEIDFFKIKPEISLKSQLANVDSALILEESKHNASENLTTKLLKQMEFYLGDSNLRNDKFLLNLLRQNEKGFIDLTIFLNFNKVKKILAEKPTLDEKLKALQQAIQSSTLIKLHKDKSKVRRRIAFNAYSHSNDKRMVYVENFPEKTTHEVLAQIFSKIGEVLLVSIPKYAETHAPKGFAFIEFKTEEAVSRAVEKYNNCIPAEFLTEEMKCKVIPLKVISKMQWLEMKQEFKNLKEKLLNLAGRADSHYEQKNHSSVMHNEDEGFVEKNIDRKEGCLVRLENLEKEALKQDILVALKHFCAPAYIDYKRGSESCVVRFDNKTLREAFCEKCEVAPMKILKNIVSVKKIEGEAENLYWEEIKKKKNSFRHYLYNKKHQDFSKKQKK